MFLLNVSLVMIFPLETRVSHATFVEVKPYIMINRFGLVSCHHFLMMYSYPIFMRLLYFEFSKKLFSLFGIYIVYFYFSSYA